MTYLLGYPNKHRAEGLRGCKSPSAHSVRRVRRGLISAEPPVSLQEGSVSTDQWGCPRDHRGAYTEV